ncbi:MAG TPA: response regulator [Luteibacter sp.]|jgi:signal transduction histidine kinase|uniref:response regulator n=1 Tax=Luteibacter sp. TaxID=1886636 RepID=UPI002F403D4D
MTDAFPPAVNRDLAWLDGGGELGALIRAFHWETTELGPLATWPQSLRTATSLLLLSPVPIVLLWGEKGIMIYNDAYSVFAGGRHPQLLGSEVRQGWDEIADFNDNVMRVGLAGGTLAYKNQRLTLQRHNKPESVWMNLDYSPVLDESGMPGGVIAIVVETTEYVRAEEQKMEALGSLTGGIAHDFNNLLMAVQGSLELLRERIPQDPMLLRLVDNARAGAERGSSLTRRMLAFARRQDLKAERVDLRVLIDGMAEGMRRSLGSTITVETHFAKGLPAVEADASQLESALLNLAANARDAMDGVGTIVITTSEAWVNLTDERLPAGHYVRLALSDSGAGMDEHTLKRATEPFFTTKGVGKGTGLGLSMVHGLAEQLGGMLVLRSQPDAGTTAEIWLPAMAATASMDIPRAEEPLSRRPGTGTKRLSIMMVDDDDLVRDTTVEMLEDLGYDVVTARSGAEALRLLVDHPVDVVVTDHAMPHMTGAQLAMQLRDRSPSLPVIIATGYADLPAGVRLERPRLAKPYSQASLEEAIVRALPSEG